MHNLIKLHTYYYDMTLIISQHGVLHLLKRATCSCKGDPDLHMAFENRSRNQLCVCNQHHIEDESQQLITYHMYTPINYIVQT